MAEETWLHILNSKTGERYAVRPEHYADKHAEGFRLDPDVGGQEAPKVAKPSDDAHKAASAKSEA